MNNTAFRATDTDIVSCGTYEVHPGVSQRTGEPTGWYSVVQAATGEVLSAYPTRADAIADMKKRAKESV